MRSTTFFGIAIGAICILGAFLLEGGNYQSLFMLPAIGIVLGGTLAATLAGTSLRQFARIPRLIWLTMSPRHFEIAPVIDSIVEINAIVRREGYLILRERLYTIANPFMRKLIRLCMDGMTTETITKAANAEMDYTTERHRDNIGMFRKMAGYSPTMGIIGTVVGLITTLAAVDSNPAFLIQHIATAFIATLWGIFLANMVWFPIAERLQSLHDEELRLMHLILDGVLSIQNGATSTVIRAELASALASPEQEVMLAKPLPRVKIAPIEMSVDGI